MSRISITLFIAMIATSFGGCAVFKPPRGQDPTLRLEQGSLRMSMAVSADGSIHLAEHSPLLGRIEVAPILQAENRSVGTVQVVLHQGLFYITADGFRNIWEVSPQPGTPLATYRSISVSGNPLTGVRMSRFGSPDHVCVRLDANEGGPWYVTHKGRLRDECH